MSIRIEYLAEPKLQFGQYFEHEDTKTGLAEFGPFGKNVEGLHPSEVKLGFVGTRETIAGAREWVEECGSEPSVLIDKDIDELKGVGGVDTKVIDAITAFRSGEVRMLPGGGGEYGKAVMPWEAEYSNATTIGAKGHGASVKKKQSTLFEF